MAIQPTTPTTNQPELPDTRGNMMCTLQEHIERDIRARAEQETTPVYYATVRDHAEQHRGNLETP